MASLHVIETLEEYAQKTSKKDHLYVLDFFAYWCGPCIQIESDEEDLAEELSDQVTFLRVDCDNFDTQDLLKKHRVLCAPTFVLIKNGQKKAVIIGANLEKLKLSIDQNK